MWGNVCYDRSAQAAQKTNWHSSSDSLYPKGFYENSLLIFSMNIISPEQDNDSQQQFVFEMFIVPWVRGPTLITPDNHFFFRDREYILKVL